MPQKETQEKTFDPELESTIKTALKPEFAQLSSRFDKVDKCLARLETSNSDIEGRLAQIIRKINMRRVA